MKKIFCILLSLTLVLNTVVCTYATDFGGSSGSFGKPTITLPPSKTEQLWNFMLKAMLQPYQALQDVYDFFNPYTPSDDDNSTAQKALEENVNQDENNYYINVNFFKTVNKKIQSNVHALDGYYLYDVNYSLSDFCSTNRYFKYLSDSERESLNTFFSSYDSVYCASYKNIDFAKESDFYFNGINSAEYLYIGDLNNVYIYSNSSASDKDYSDGFTYFVNSMLSISDCKLSLLSLGQFDLYNYFYVFNSPLKIFYSRQDVVNYLNKGRTYAPIFPEINLTIPKYYIDNSSTTTLPNIDLSGINIEGKTEVEIQAQIDLAMKNYFDKLLELSTKPTATPIPTSTPIPTATPSPTPTKKPATGTDPTPTPKPGITDIPTTPTPGGGNVDLSDTNNLLQKIYDWLVDFGKSHDTLAKTITDYIERNDGKLDEIIKAIDSLSKGEVTPEQNGCKYDFTALSEFLTTTWNESDKKFDTMIKLLEENNAYQQKLVNSLNEIKALLVTDTVLDLFKNRSSETANKAKEKFPTSLPWDVAMVVNSMSAEPQEINLTIPVKIESLHIDEEIHIDITGSEWEKLAKTCRYLLSLLFILYLIHLSRKLFFKGDDD